MTSSSQDYEEEEECLICCDSSKISNSNPLLSCPSCNVKFCRSCFRKTLVGIPDEPDSYKSINDPGCVSCKKLYSRNTLIEMLTASFVKKQLKERREELIFERAKSSFPEILETIEENKVLYQVKKKLQEKEKEFAQYKEDRSEIGSNENKIYLINSGGKTLLYSKSLDLISQDRSRQKFSSYDYYLLNYIPNFFLDILDKYFKDDKSFNKIFIKEYNKYVDEKINENNEEFNLDIHHFKLLIDNKYNCSFISNLFSKSRYNEDVYEIKSTEDLDKFKENFHKLLDNWEIELTRLIEFENLRLKFHYLEILKIISSFFDEDDLEEMNEYYNINEEIKKVTIKLFKRICKYNLNYSSAFFYNRYCKFLNLVEDIFNFNKKIKSSSYKNIIKGLKKEIKKVDKRKDVKTLYPNFFYIFGYESIPKKFSIKLYKEIIDRFSQILYYQNKRLEVFFYDKFCNFVEKLYKDEKNSYKYILNSIQANQEINADKLLLEVKKPKRTIKCINENCRGVMNSKYACSLCNWIACKDCYECIYRPGKSKKDYKEECEDMSKQEFKDFIKKMKREGFLEINEIDTHECDPETIETVKILKQDTKPCPECGNAIEKISGCSQMFCTSCNTKFDWNTMEVYNGKDIYFHNPHFTEWRDQQARLRIQTINHNDGGEGIICPQDRNLDTEYRNKMNGLYLDRSSDDYFKLGDAIAFVAHCRRTQNDIMNNIEVTNVNKKNELLSNFLVQEISEKKVRKELQIIDKKETYLKEEILIWAMLGDVISDITIRFLNEKDILPFRKISNKIIKILGFSDIGDWYQPYTFEHSLRNNNSILEHVRITLENLEKLQIKFKEEYKQSLLYVSCIDNVNISFRNVSENIEVNIFNTKQSTVFKDNFLFNIFINNILDILVKNTFYHILYQNQDKTIYDYLEDTPIIQYIKKDKNKKRDERFDKYEEELDNLRIYTNKTFKDLGEAFEYVYPLINENWEYRVSSDTRIVSPLHKEIKKYEKSLNEIKDSSPILLKNDSEEKSSDKIKVIKKIKDFSFDYKVGKKILKKLYEKEEDS